MSPTFSLSCNPLGHGPTLSCKSKVCRKLAELPHTAVNARSHTFLQIIWHGNRHSRCLQGISARAMAPICVHRAPRTPPDSTPGHIRSRDVLQETRRPATHSRQRPVPHFPANHLARQSPFHGPPGHIRPRDDLPESVTSIGEAEFYNCPTIIYVPLGSEETYKKGWPSYASRIFGYDYSAEQ